MTPAALLVCMTIVTNVDHGSVVTRDCHYELSGVSVVSQDATPAVPQSAAPTVPQIAAAAVPKSVVPAVPKSAAPAFARRTYQTRDLMVTASTTAVAESKPARLHHKKKLSRQAMTQYRTTVKRVKPVMTAEQNRAFRFSWFERLLAQ
jgi:hypothetical protein